MPDKMRGRPYVWPSWITKLLAGEEHCWWRAWYKSHYKYEKVPDDPERAEFFREWTAKHDAITQRRAQELRDQGYLLKIEEEGQFKLVGDRADLSGKPDIVAMKDSEALVVDAKSGRRRESDHWQVLLYIFALPMSWLQGYSLRGEVEYQGCREQVRPMSPEVREKIVQAMRKITGTDSPSAVPSQFECRYCDIASCPVRWRSEDEHGDARGFF